jgi:hypothetical protein
MKSLKNYKYLVQIKKEKAKKKTKKIQILKKMALKESI